MQTYDNEMWSIEMTNIKAVAIIFFSDEQNLKKKQPLLDALVSICNDWEIEPFVSIVDVDKNVGSWYGWRNTGSMSLWSNYPKHWPTFFQQWKVALHRECCRFAWSVSILVNHRQSPWQRLLTWIKKLKLLKKFSFLFVNFSNTISPHKNDRFYSPIFRPVYIISLKSVSNLKIKLSPNLNLDYAYKGAFF